jgi:bifunctional ADP-heptose synthase (sugar kinase/adenylyltransferase)
LLRFKDVDLLCPTEREIRQTLNNFSSGLNAVVYELLERTKARAAMITLGKQGLCLFDDRKKAVPKETWDRKLRTAYLPALSGSAIDPLGCGDALLAIASLALAAGATAQAAAFLGSLAAGIEVQRVGNEPITTDQLLSHLNRTPRQIPARLAS